MLICLNFPDVLDTFFFLPRLVAGSESVREEPG